ncbi:LysE family translocator [Geminicoccaceae bacterium 1502E]|nr:LysE family translocator [Geminicoccaceae bacterium 1502E]
MAVDPAGLLALQVAPFALSASITPGPNNLLVMASASRFGLRPTLPHMLGILAGFPAMLVAVGLGIAPAFERMPQLHLALQIAGILYLVYLAWRIGLAAGPAEARGSGRPLSFVQAALFQWINPKAWAMALGSLATYTSVGGELLGEVTSIAGVFALAAAPSIACWALLGDRIRRLLQTPATRRLFNWAMALLILASLLPAFRSILAAF